MRTDNHIGALLREDEVVFGASATTGSPIMMDVYADVGLDYVWIDHEHTGPPTADASRFESIARATNSAGIEPIVRVESPDPSEVRKVIDAGIRTYVVPRVEGADQLADIVLASRFEYDGSRGGRGLGTCYASNWGKPSCDHVEAEDAAVLPGVMIENQTAVANIDELFSVPGLGFAQVGPTDLSISMGHPLQRDHPDVVEAIDRTITAGRKHDVPVGVSAGYVGGVEAAIDKGCQLIKLGNDVGAVRDVLAGELRKGIDKTDRSPNR